jgi:two-component system nitrate/nitrite response regulator NarL
MFFIYTSSSLAFHSIKKTLASNHISSRVDYAENLEIANLENRYFIIDANELSHKKVINFLKNNKDLSKILIFINELRKKEIVEIVNLGIKHLISYHLIENDLLEAIDKLKKNETFFSEDIKVILLNSLEQKHPNPSNLTKKEEEIISLLGQGFNATEVGAALNISNLTVNVHRSNIKRKLNISSNSHFIKYCSDSCNQ